MPLILNTSTTPGTASWDDSSGVIFNEGLASIEFPAGLSAGGVSTDIGPASDLSLGSPIVVGWQYDTVTAPYVDPGVEVMITGRVISSNTVRLTVFNPNAAILVPFRVIVKYAVVR